MSEPTETSVRSEVRAWLEANWNPDYGLVEWTHTALRVGLGCAALPSNGRPRTCRWPSTPCRRGIRRIGCDRCRQGRHPTLAAATILAHGTDLHKEKYLKRILTGEDTCASC